MAKEERLVEQVMHQGILDCQSGTPVAEVARRMVENDVSALIVTDEQGYLAGVVSRTDLVTLRAFEEYWAELTAEHAMVRQVVTISPEASLSKACRLIVERKIHRLVVVENEGDQLRPVGVLSQTDIVRDMTTGV